MLFGWYCKGVLRHNERSCTVWAPELGLGKKKYWLVVSHLHVAVFCIIFVSCQMCSHVSS